jgi:hypothetical protein
MDAALVALAQSAAATVVPLMATDAWEQVKTALGQLWRRVHPQRAATVEAELAETRADVLAARRSGDMQAEQDLVIAWQARLRQLLAADPQVAAMLTELMEQVLRPALAAQPSINVTMHASASGQGQVFQAGRDQRIDRP